MSPDEPRTQYAVDVLGDLFPGSTVGASRGRSPQRTFALAPSGRRPRLLVPTSPRDAAATALRAYGGRLTHRARWGYQAAASAVAAAGPGLLRSRLVVSDHNASSQPAIDHYLSEVLGREVSIAVHLTPSRANRKPVIQSLAAGERHPVGFTKLGVNPLTTRLIDQEAVALGELATRSLEHLVIPMVTDHGRFADNAVLTLEPLPTWRPGRSPSLADVAPAAREVAELAGIARTPLTTSDYWQRVERQSHDLPATQAADRLRQCVDQAATAIGGAEITFTASHGDWSPWNMWLTDDRLLVWDWERFESRTPAGFDLLHFRLNEQFIRGGRRPADAGHQLRTDAADVLRHSGSPDRPLHTVVLYLIHLGLRYEADGQAAVGPALGRLDTWLLPALEAVLADSALTKRT